MADIVLDVSLPSPSEPDNDAPKQVIPGRDGPEPATEETLSGISETVQLLVKCCVSSAPTMDAVKENLEQIAKNSNTAGKMAAQEPNSPEGKGKKKINEYFLKRMVGADLLTKMGGYLKQIAAGGLNLLKALLLLAMLGPEMLDGIIDLLVNVAMMLVNALIRAIPVVVNAIVKWLPVIINLITDLIPVLLNTLIQAFSALANNENIPAPIRLFFKGLEMLAKAVKWVTENLWIFIPVIALVVAAYAAMIVVQLAQIALKVVEALVYIAVNIELIVVIGLIALLVIGIIALVAVFIALYVWADEIAEWFESLWDQFQHLSLGMKIFVVALALLFWPLTLIVVLIYGIVKLFQWIKHGGPAKALEAIKPKIQSVLDWIKSLPDRMLEGLKSIGTSINKALSGVVDSIFGEGTSQKVRDFFTDVFNKVKEWAKAHGLGVLFGEEDKSYKDTSQGRTTGENRVTKNDYENATIRAVQHSIGDSDATKKVGEDVYEALKAGPTGIDNMLKNIKSNMELYGTQGEGDKLIEFLESAKKQIHNQEEANLYLRQMAAAANKNPALTLKDAPTITGTAAKK